MRPIGKISKKDYKRNIRHVRLILEGKRDQLYRNLQKEMVVLSQKQKFEEAAVVRDQLQAIGALYSGTKDVNSAFIAKIGNTPFAVYGTNGVV